MRPRRQEFPGRPCLRDRPSSSPSGRRIRTLGPSFRAIGDHGSRCRSPGRTRWHPGPSPVKASRAPVRSAPPAPHSEPFARFAAAGSRHCRSPARFPPSASRAAAWGVAPRAPGEPRAWEPGRLGQGARRPEPVERVWRAAPIAAGEQIRALERRPRRPSTRGFQAQTPSSRPGSASFPARGSGNRTIPSRRWTWRCAGRPALRLRWRRESAGPST